MVRLTTSISVDASPKAVWEFIGDPELFPQWIDFVELMLSDDSNMATEGTIFRVRGGFTRLTSEYGWRIANWDSPRWQRHECTSGSLQPTFEVELIPEENGTKVLLSLQYEFLPQFPRLGWWLEVVFVRQVIHLFVRWWLNDSLRKTARNIERGIQEKQSEV